MMNEIGLYLSELKHRFAEEQYASTTLVPLVENEKDFNIKNRQFNFFIQFRSISSTKNDYDFTKNSLTGTINRAFYAEKDDQNGNINITLHSSLIKFQQDTRNRYRIIEFFLHSLTLITFWFKIDLITLPISLKNAYPLVKYFGIYFLYFAVSLLIFLFDIVFKFFKFLKFKNN